MLDDTKFFEGVFAGKLITSRPGFLIGQGNYTEMQNMRYKSGGIGVETRNGCQRFNDTAVSGGADVDKIWQHLYQRAQTDYQDVYIVSNESPRNIYKMDSVPESGEGNGSIGSALVALTANAKIPTFCAVEDVAIACSDKDLLATVGTGAYCIAFYVGTDVGNVTTAAAEDDKTFSIFTDEVTDEDTSTMASFTLDTLANNMALYVGYWQPIDGITLDLGTLNDVAGVLTAKYWNGSAWTSIVTGWNDGTDVAGDPLKQDGTLSWTYIAAGTEKPRRINGLTLFWYRIETDTLLDAVTVLKCTVTKDWRAIEDVTDGADVLPSGLLWFDDTDDSYVDFGAEVASDSKGTYAKFADATADTDIAAGDIVYVGFPIRVMGFRIEVDGEYPNTGATGAAMTPAYWDGAAWQNYAADEFFDGTFVTGNGSLNQSGDIRLEDKGTTVRMTTVGPRKLPMFWYRLVWDLKMFNNDSDEMRIWKIRGVPAPKTIKNYTCCLNFKDFLFLFGREDAPNTGDYSFYKNPFQLSGQGTSSVQPRVTFGSSDRITAAVNFYNEAIVFKRTEVWMMEGDSPENFGTLLLDNTVGCVAPETVKLVRMWIQNPDGNTQYQHVIVFQALDGIYGVDGIKVFKLSEDIENYFDPSEAEVIKDGYLSDSRSWYDNLRSEYHYIFWSGATPTIKEFVLSTELKRWSGPWPRAVDVLCGATLLGASTQYLQYGGGTDGRVYHLETNSYNDVDVSNVATGISNHVTLGDVWREVGNKYGFRGVHLFGEAQAAGSVTIKMQGDAKSSAVTLGTILMTNSGYGNFQGKVPIGDEDSGGTAMENKFQSSRFQFSNTVTAQKMNLYGYRIKRQFIGEAAL
jgi:hypothetical protein